MAETSTKRWLYVKHVTPLEETWRVRKTSERFTVLEETEKALVALEVMISALDARPA